MFCAKCGNELNDNARFCDKCGAEQGAAQQSAPKQDAVPETESEQIARNVYEKSRISSIFWIILGAVQILGCVTIVAGVWNLVMGIRSYQALPEIKPYTPGVYNRFASSLNNLIITAAINLILGGGIGVVLSVMDYFTREQVLRHKEIFF